MTEEKRVNEREKLIGEKEDCKMVEESAKPLELGESYMRLLADFDNYRKRAAKEKAELIERSEEGLIVDLLEFLDEMDVYIEHIEGAEREGAEQAFSKLLTALKKHGLEILNPAGMPFSPDIAEAVQKIGVRDKKKDGLILQLIQKGYSFKGKILRYPKVIVGHYTKD